MAIIRTFFAFIAAVVVAYTLATVFYTSRILAAQSAIGADYSPAQTTQTYIANFVGLAEGYGVVMAGALAIGFAIAWIVKKILRPLAPIAYPIAGAAAIATMIYLIENVMAGGGAGAIGGARSPIGFALQCLAGAAGGLVFSMLRPVDR